VSCLIQANNTLSFLARFLSDLFLGCGVPTTCSNTKQIIVTFRGSQGTPFSTRDWQTNVNARLETLRTPKQIKDKMPEGDLQKRVLVHKGFHGE